MPARLDLRIREITPGDHPKRHNLHGKYGADSSVVTAVLASADAADADQDPDGADLVAGPGIGYSLGTAEEREIKSPSEALRTTRKRKCGTRRRSAKV